MPDNKNRNPDQNKQQGTEREQQQQGNFGRQEQGNRGNQNQGKPDLETDDQEVGKPHDRDQDIERQGSQGSRPVNRESDPMDRDRNR